MRADEKNLDLLAVFHYILAPISALFSCFSFILMTVLLYPEAMSGTKVVQPPPLFIRFALVMGIVSLLYGLLYVICLVMAGRFLKKRRHYIFCLVVAAWTCMWMPFGTILGVFTIIMLVKPEVKVLFDQPGIPAASAPGSAA
jgi:hypothetical protein